MAILNDSPGEVIRKSSHWVDENVEAKIHVDFPEENGARDAFGRIRISTPIEQFGNKNIYSGNEHVWHKKEVGTGAITYLPNESAMSLAVGTASGDVAIRQSRPNVYIPGKSQLINMTGVLGASPTENNIRRMGSFDDENGLFIEQNGSTVNFVVRSNVSGSVVEDRIPQSEWNVYKYPDLDTSKTIILVISFQWLGVGAVNFSLVQPNGQARLCHVFRHTNTTTAVYMRTPTLPMRYENRNVGTTSTGTVLKEICCSTASEGGTVRTGYNFSIGGRARTIVEGPAVPFFAIRLKSAFNSKKNRVLFQVVGGDLFTKSANTLFQLVRVSEPASIVGTWADIDARSASEFSADITSYTGAEESIVATAFLTATALGSKVQSAAAPVGAGQVNEHSFISQNVDSDNSDLFVVKALSTDGTDTDVAVGFSFIEFH